MQSSEFLTLVLTQVTVTTFSVAVGFLSVHNELRKFRSQKRFEIQIARLEKQLSEFYGPLHMLTQTTGQIAKNTWGTDIWQKTFKEVLLPAQCKIEEILLTRAHLLEEEEIPLSYLDFLRHVNISKAYAESGMTVSYFEKNSTYPLAFPEDIQRMYHHKRSQYAALLGEQAELKPPSRFRSPL
jgi:hypothetical protein